MANIDHNEEEFLEELSPNLFPKRVKGEIQPPEGYFDGLAERVVDRIKSNDNVDKRRGIIRYINYPNLAIAAGLTLILALSPVLMNLFEDKPTDETGAGVAVEIPENTSIDQLEIYLSEEFILDDIELEDLDHMASADPDLEGEEIINYLLEEEVSYELVLEETLKKDEL